jgi:hypothetical protein
MAKAILFVVAGFGLLGLGFLIGTSSAKPPSTDPTGPRPDATSHGPGEEVWTYPGAVRSSELRGIREEIAGVLFHLSGYASAWTTADDYDKVAKHYVDLLRIKSVDLSKFPHTQSVAAESSPDGSATVGVLRVSGSADNPAGKMHVLFRRTPGYEVSVVISRPDGEKQTRIAILYDVK